METFWYSQKAKVAKSRPSRSNSLDSSASTRTTEQSAPQSSRPSISPTYSQHATEELGSNSNSFALALDPIYTFEEFLKTEEDEEEIEIREGYNNRRANPQLQRFSHNFYDNVALDVQEEQIVERPNCSQPVPVASTTSQQLVGRFTNQPNAEHVGFYVVNERQQRPCYNPNGNPPNRRSSRSVSIFSGNSSTAPNHTAPRVLCASSLTTEQLEDKQVTGGRDRLHPILRRSFCSILREIFCCEKSTIPSETQEQEENLDQKGMCAKCFCCFRQGRGNTRADQYRMADATEPAVEAQPRFSWEQAGRPSPLNYRFSNIEGTVKVKKRGEIAGQQFIIENCQNSVLMVLDNLGAVTVDDCKNCIIILGPCSGRFIIFKKSFNSIFSVFIRDCSECTIFTICQQFRSRDCSITVHLFCATSPIVEETTAHFYPLYLRYPFIEENMAQSGLSPFTNYWHKVHNFTPDSAQFTVNEIPKPIEKMLETVDVRSELQNERVTVESTDSFFLKTPINKKIGDQEERVLLLFNLIPGPGELSSSSFYSTTMSVVQRLCSDPEVSRLIVSHDLNIRPGELANVLCQKITLNGKLISVELAGPLNQCRSFVTTLMEPVNYPGIQIQILPVDQTENYRRNLDRLADVQSNV